MRPPNKLANLGRRLFLTFLVMLVAMYIFALILEDSVDLSLVPAIPSALIVAIIFFIWITKVYGDK